MLQLDLNIHTGRQIQTHQLIDRLRARIDDVNQPFMRTDLIVLLRILVYERPSPDTELSRS